MSEQIEKDKIEKDKIYNCDCLEDEVSTYNTGETTDGKGKEAGKIKQLKTTSNMDKTIIKIRNPRITCNPVNDQINIEEWCIRLDNITELFMQDGKCFVIFSTRWYNMRGAGSILDLCAEITVEEYDEILSAINGITVIRGEEIRKHFKQ